jgi:hypothetical protein
VTGIGPVLRLADTLTNENRGALVNVAAIAVSHGHAADRVSVDI